MTSFRKNPAFEREIKRDPHYKTGLLDATREVKRNAEIIAQQSLDTGRYGRSFVIEETHDGYAVGNTDIAAHLQEWGSVNNPPRGTLRRAALAAGLDLHEQ